MQPKLHEGKKEAWAEYHLDQELEQFVKGLRSHAPKHGAYPEPVVQEV